MHVFNVRASSLPLGHLSTTAKFRLSPPSTGELAHREKSHTQSLTHSPSLFDAPGTKAFISEIQHIKMLEISKITYNVLRMMLNPSLSMGIELRMRIIFILLTATCHEDSRTTGASALPGYVARTLLLGELGHSEWALLTEILMLLKKAEGRVI